MSIALHWSANMFSTKTVKVWHQDSPGMRVMVRRNWWQRLIYPKHFSGVGEKHL